MNMTIGKNTAVMVSVLIFSMVGAITLTAQESRRSDISAGDAMSARHGITLLYNGTCDDRLFAIDVFLRNGNTEPEVVEGLIACLHSGSNFKDRSAGRVTNDFWEVRMRSAQALGAIASDRALFELHKALRYEQEPVVRAALALAIGDIGEPRSIPHLARAAELAMSSGTSENTVVVACARALGEIGHGDGFWPLYRIASGADTREVRIAARKALEKIR
jgi:HEAT repeat protein